MARTFRSIAEHGAALTVAARSPGAVLASVSQAAHLLLMGAVVVRTPESGKAMLATSIQLDGDMVTVVCGELLGPAHALDRDRLALEHLGKLHGALMPLQRVDLAVRAFGSLLVAMFAAVQFLSLYRALAEVAAIEWSELSLSRLIAALPWPLALQLVALLPLALRRVLPRLIRWRLDAHLAPLLNEWRSRSREEVHRMRNGGPSPLVG